MNDKQPVFLVGFMGSGKTTWGRKLANRTARPFIDLDEAIVSVAGMPIADYFARHGEAAFRELESRTLKSLPLETAPIVSTGGGTPCYFDNMSWMNGKGVTVYLHLPPKALWDRLLQSDIASRPALKGLSGEALLDEVTARLAEREPHYRQAKRTVNQLTLRMEDLVAALG